LINDPLRQLCRYDLLKSLHAQEVNDFNLWHAGELPEDIRFPVFVRLARDHSGPKTDLIDDRTSLDRALASMLLLGFRPEDLLVVEYVCTADAAGIFHKYSAYRIGKVVFSHFALISPDWNVKVESALGTREALEENAAYIEQDAHADLLMPFFEQAAIEHGRVDYSFAGDRIQIWEINDNPQFVSPNTTPRSKAFNFPLYLSALDALGEDLDLGRSVPLAAFDEGMWRCLERAPRRAAELRPA